MHPFDPDARITKMKAGGTHLAHKAEHAVDLETGAIIAVTMQQADVGDTTTMVETLAKAGETLAEVASKVNSEQAGELVNPIGPQAVIADKGYHSNDALIRLKQVNVRAYIAEPNRGRRRWAGKQEAQKAVYANRRRITGSHGKSLLRRRGEFVERSFAHVYETGGMRRTHLRGSENILKRVLLHVGAFNLGLVLRQLTGKGTPRGLQGSKQALLAAFSALRFWSIDFVSVVTALFRQQSCQTE